MSTAKKQSLTKRFIAETQSDLNEALKVGLDPLAEYLEALEALSTPDLLSPSLLGNHDGRLFAESLPGCTDSTIAIWVAVDLGTDAA